MKHRLGMIRNEIDIQLLGLTLDEKLKFLTEIFCLTEEIRWELTEGHQKVEELPRNVLPLRKRKGNLRLQESSSGDGEK